MKTILITSLLCIASALAGAYLRPIIASSINSLRAKLAARIAPKG